MIDRVLMHKSVAARRESLGLICNLASMFPNNCVPYHNVT